MSSPISTDPKSVRQVIHLIPWPLMPGQEERYGFAALRRSGFDVRVFDLSLLLNADVLRRFPVSPLLEAPFIERFSTYESFAAAIRGAAGGAVFFDYLLGPANIDWRYERVYRILRKADARLFIVFGGGFPPPRPARILSRWRELLDPRKIVDAATCRLIAKLRSHTRLYPFAERVFGTPCGIPQQYIKRWRLPPETLVPCNSFDYDAYVRFRQATPSPQEDGTCVYLDEAATHHPDVGLVGGQSLEREPYESIMNALFDEVERQRGLRVVIAAHPRARYDLHRGFFGGRPIIKDRTVELVSRCSMVISHASTSISYPILFEKPILLVKTLEMAKIGYDRYVDGVADQLGLAAKTLSGPEDARKLDLSALPALPGLAQEYRYKFIQSREASDEPVWALVARFARAPHSASMNKEPWMSQGATGLRNR